jgi:hypothetical protein
LQISDPRSGQPYFDPTVFSKEALGLLGTADKRMFHGPGINNWDMALLKDTKITESKTLQLRFEFFNVFNHAQFQNPTGSILNGTFGRDKRERSQNRADCAEAAVLKSGGTG